MSQNPTQLSNPRPDERVPLGTQIYFRTRNQQRVWEMIVNEFSRSGITQAELSTRTGRDRKRVCEFLGSPGNFTLDTISDYLFAMSGAQLEYTISHPLGQVPYNENDDQIENEFKPQMKVTKSTDPLSKKVELVLSE